ncbi:hypothetical protein GCM10009792_21800 [Microcella alkalica]|uniref:Uncharacterized protein n=1 Tax=Microcella alkalica TaxID=355930 RepID=A0A839E5I0_9MICO|nr:hypothetical protein [Microcella alkalica]MBA8847631.1 hypothetical protein [Microcella alkalica]
MMRPVVLAAARAIVVAAALAALVACGPTVEPEASPSASPTASPTAEPSSSPTPSPDPTRPALAELVLSADGLDPLVLGEAPDEDPATRMIAFEPGACVSAELGIAPGDPGADLWRTDAAHDSTSPAYGPGTAFGVGVDRDSGAVTRVDLYSADIPTDGGVRIGDPGSSVAAAHPGATVVPEYLTDIHVVSGPIGTLQIEVAKNPADMSGDYWEGRTGTVVYIHAVSFELGVFSVAASGNLVGVCGA